MYTFRLITDLHPIHYLAQGGNCFFSIGLDVFFITKLKTWADSSYLALLRHIKPVMMTSLSNHSRNGPSAHWDSLRITFISV